MRMHDSLQSECFAVLFTVSVGSLTNLSSVLLCLLYMSSITPVLSRIMITINHNNVDRTDGYRQGLDDSGVVFNYDL
jgi:hypothetical protein